MGAGTCCFVLLFYVCWLLCSRLGGFGFVFRLLFVIIFVRFIGFVVLVVVMIIIVLIIL